MSRTWVAVGNNGAMSSASGRPHEDSPRRHDDEETIRLGQFLKWANMVETGGEARELVQAGCVRVDGEVETRRGRQLHRGQQVTLAYPGEPEVTVVVDDL